MSPAAYESVEDEGEDDDEGEVGADDGGGGRSRGDAQGRAANASASAVAGEITAAVTGATAGSELSKTTRGVGTVGVGVVGDDIGVGVGVGGAEGGEGVININDLELQPMEVEGGARAGSSQRNQRVATAYPRMRGLLTIIAQVHEHVYIYML